jgi:hypothetical protein
LCSFHQRHPLLLSRESDPFAQRDDLIASNAFKEGTVASGRLLSRHAGQPSPARHIVDEIALIDGALDGMRDMLPPETENVQQGVERGGSGPRDTALDIGQRLSRDPCSRRYLRLGAKRFALELALTMTLQELTKVGTQPDSVSRQQHAAGAIRLGHGATRKHHKNS